MKKLKIATIKKYFLYFLSPVLFFSYHPVLTVGKNASMNLEFSLPLIWLLCFSIISLPTAFIFLKNKNNKIPLLSIIFPIFTTISIFWTPNKLRGVLTTGVFWCIWIAIISIYDFLKKIKNKEQFKKTFLKIFFISTGVVCLFCWLQCILDVVGVSRGATLLCAGCVSQTFGFPHPNGFAIEPQFMGNLLILPSLISLYFLFEAENKSQKIFLTITTFLFTGTLFLTFSRGAIYSFCVAIVVLLSFEILQKKNLKKLLIIPILLISFLFSLSMQGVFAAASKTNDTFLTGISKSINQLSLGLVNFTQKDEAPKRQESDPEENSSTFDGYVEESTNTRLSLSEIALKAWINKPVTFVFGYGIGSAGTILNVFDDNVDSDKQIVQNEPIEIALELGLFGLVMTFALGILTFKIIKKSNQKSLFFAILLAFVISFLFFSGFPNALHIFLLPPALFLLLENQSIVNQITHHHCR